MAAEALVHAVNVTKSFGANQVLKGIDMDVHKGEVVCFLGPSGSGKTTFLRCINQLETIDGGRIWVDGELMGYADRGGQLHRLHDKEIARQRRDIGMVFQRFNLFPHMTVLDNIIEAPVQVKGEKKAEVSVRAKELLERVGLADKPLAYPGQLSGASNSGSRSRARWRCAPSSCSSTSRPRRSTRNSSGRCSPSCASWRAKA